MTASADGLLAGLRVLDISETIAGAYCTRLLAGLGAEVTLVERPDGGHPARRLGPFPHDRPDPELSAAHLYFNAGKRSVTADIRSTERRERLLSLVSGVELLVESLTEPEAESLELTPEALRAANPGLQIVSVTPWGRTGPWAARPGNELTVEALCGMASTQGEPPREPLKLPGWQMECFAGVFAAIGGVSALFEGGPPRLIEVSVLEAATNAMEMGLAGWAYTGRRPMRTMRSSDRFYPLNVWPCCDGHVALAFYHSRDWEGLTLVLGDERLRDTERFGGNARRIRNRDALDAILGPLLEARQMRDVFEAAIPLRSAIGMVLDPASLLGDPHLRDRIAFAEVEHPVAGRYTMPAAPFITSEGVWRVARAPLLGEHDGDAVGGEAGLKSGLQGSRDGDRPFRPLDGVRVLELSVAWAGPTAGRVLGGLGADVIKVESCTWWDAWRGPAVAAPTGFGVYADGDPGTRPYERTPLFGAANRNKRGITLDLTKPEGHDLFLRLVEKSDVVLSNFTARVLPNLRLGYEDLRSVRPDIILLHMPAYGASGPYRDGVGYGNTIEAMGGMAARFGYVGGPPHITHDLTLGDPVGGIHAALAVLAALRHRRGTGRGAYIDLSQQQTMLAFQGEAIVRYSLDGHFSGPEGCKTYAYAPHGYYPCAGPDQWIAVAATDDEAWLALRNVLGDPAWMGDERFTSNEGRIKSEAELDRLLSLETVLRDKVELADRLADAGVAAAPVLVFEEVRAHSHVTARRAFEPVDHPEAGRRMLPRLPLTVDGGPVFTLRHTPLFGQHNAEVLDGLLGLTGAEIERLRELEVIGDEPSARPAEARA